MAVIPKPARRIGVPVGRGRSLVHLQIYLALGGRSTVSRPRPIDRRVESMTGVVVREYNIVLFFEGVKVVGRE